MYPNLSLVGILLASSILFALVLRFVQPELIYSLRQLLLQVKTNKLFLDYESGRPNVIPSFQELLVKDFRYEALTLDEEYVFHRIDKIRELYRTLDPRRPLANSKLAKEQQPQVCIIELAALLGSLGRQVTPRSEYHQPVISGRGLLTHIANEIRKSQDYKENLIDDESVSEWFSYNPLSIEQTIEIMIAAAYGLALRQSSVTEPQEKIAAQEFPRIDNALPIILNTEKKLRFLIRTEYQRRYKTEHDSHRKVKEALGDTTYSACLRRMEESRSGSQGLALDFFDFLYIGQLETLIFAEWELFRQALKEKSWLKQRIEKIIQVRNELVHGRPVEARVAMLAIGYCGEIEDRVQGLGKRDSEAS